MITQEEIVRRQQLFDKGYWEIPDNIDCTGFDFNWRPDPWDRPYIHQFGTQWQKTGGPKFIVPNNEGVKYHSFQRVTRLPDLNDRGWRPLIANATFDFSWHPDETEPPFIYVFGNQWYDVDTMPTYQYRVKGATQKKYMYDVMAKLVPDMSKWDNTENIDSSFDYSWIPHPHEPSFIWEFGTQYQSNGGPRYISDNATYVKETNVQVAKRINGEQNRAWRVLVDNVQFDYNWHPDKNDPPYIYVFGNQHYGPDKMPTVLYRVKGATQKKYVYDIKATLLPNKSKWIIPDDIDDSNFDYSWVPDPYEPPFTYQFGTQWQRTGGPKYVVKENTDIKYIDTQKVIKKPNLRNWRVIEHIVDFDYSWHPDETENYSYVFGNQYFDPEIMPTIIYKNKTSTEIKYSKELVPKLDIRVINYTDSIFDSIKENNFDTAYAYFTKNNSIDYSVLNGSPDTLHLLGENVLAPKNIKNKIYDKLTDYHKIVNHNIKIDTKPLDIVFFSNGESCAEENYNHLLEITKNLPNKVIRIDGVKGRVASQHAAANSSNTDWYFLINAKLWVNNDFDFTWQPDIYKSRRHYIFTAYNPVNGLKYGHQAIVANNKFLTLNTNVRGLDFTMDSPTEVVNIDSGISRFNTSEWDTYRTAFRECIKLRYYNDKQSLERLSTWLSTAKGDFAQYSLQGAKDAVDYFESVDGDLDKLKLSYDWAWIKERFTK